MRRLRNYQPHTAAVFQQSKKTDLQLLFAVIIISFFGLLMVFDASQVEAFRDVGDSYYFIRQQAIWLTLGFLCLIFFTFFDHLKLKRFASPIFFLAVALLLFVFIPGLGVSAGGAHRWLKLGFITIQPAEIIKFASIIYLASIFQKKVSTIRFLAITAIPIFIIGILQKDLGSAIIYSLISFGMFFISGAPIIYFLISLVLGALAFAGFIISSPYRLRRVMAFLDPFSDPQGYSYHISQVLIALGSGGLLGLGLGQSRQKYSYIPEVTTDSIFSVVGEEFGFIGALVLISVFGFIIFRALKISQKASNGFSQLLATGLTVWIGSQAVVNLSAMVSLIPLTGVPLPFISYGGSALLANLAAIGILLNISRKT